MPYDICEHEATLDYIEQQMASRGITQHQIEETRAKTEIEMLQFLREQIKAGVSLESIEFDCGASALHVAAANGYLDVVELLLEHNFPTNVVDCDLWQPIHAAACWGHVSSAVTKFKKIDFDSHKIKFFDRFLFLAGRC